jgi:hypothetical protein
MSPALLTDQIHHFHSVRVFHSLPPTNLSLSLPALFVDVDDGSGIAATGRPHPLEFYARRRPADVNR